MRRTVMNAMKSTAKKIILKPCFLLFTFGIILLAAASLYAAESDVELMNRAKAIFGPLPASMPSSEHPITPEKVKLGTVLFW